MGATALPENPAAAVIMPRRVEPLQKVDITTNQGRLVHRRLEIEFEQVRVVAGRNAAETTGGFEPPIERRAAERRQEPGHRHHDAVFLDEFKQPVKNGWPVGIVADDKTAQHFQTGCLNHSHFLAKVTAVLFLVHLLERRRINGLNANEDLAETGLHHLGQNLPKTGVGQIDTGFGEEGERETVFNLPTIEFRQEFGHSRRIADEVVVKNENGAAPAGGQNCVQFGQKLPIGLGSRFVSVEDNDVAELAIKRTTARKLNCQRRVTPELDQIPTRNWRRGNRGLAFFGQSDGLATTDRALVVDPRGPAGQEIFDEEIQSGFRFVKDEIIGAHRQNLVGMGGGEGTADHHDFARSFGASDASGQRITLNNHCRQHHQIGLRERRVRKQLHIEVNNRQDLETAGG